MGRGASPAGAPAGDALIEVHVKPAHALLSVAAYRLINFLAPVLPGLFAHSSLLPMLDEQAAREDARASSG